MTGREKILLSLMGASVVAGGGYVYMDTARGDSAKTGSTSTVSEAHAFVEKCRARLEAMSLNGEQMRQLSLVAQPWDRNPFLASAAKAAPGAITPGGFRYSGYLDLEGERYAVVNGWEYQVGDLLEGHECMVTDIDESYVTAIRISDGVIFKIKLNQERGR